MLRELLLPRQWKPSEDRSFLLDAEQINTLCDQAERVFLEEPTVLRLRGETEIQGHAYDAQPVSLCEGYSPYCSCKGTK